MAKHIVIKAVFGKNICIEITVVVQPVVRELLGAKNKNRAIAQFVVLYDSKCSECFTQANTVSKNTSIVCFQLIDDAYSSVLLVVKKLLPYKCILVASSVIWQNVFINIAKKFTENIIKNKKINSFRGIFMID